MRLLISPSHAEHSVAATHTQACPVFSMHWRQSASVQPQTRQARTCPGLRCGTCRAGTTLAFGYFRSVM